MRSLSRRLGLAVLLSSLAACAAAPDNLVESRSLSAQKKVLPPFGFVKMCVEKPALCEETSGRLTEPENKVRLDDNIYRQLEAVNSAVNRQIRPVRDGKLDNWQINPARGDCEDYALTKKSHLLRQGLPASALAIAVVKLRNGDKHAVLLVHTDRGSLLLDNLSHKIVPIARTPYRLISMQVSDSGLSWARI